jgi:glycosyltransferase involved in cell wall biosynthesis
LNRTIGVESVNSMPECMWSGPDNEGATISILVRTLNEAQCLPEFWRRLEEQTIFPLAEIVFLDSGSTDGTLEFLRSKPCAVYAIAKDSFNFGRSVNQLMTLSHAPVVMLLSAHVLLDEPTALEAIVSLLDPQNAEAAFLRQIPNHVFGYNTYDAAYLKRRFPAGKCAVTMLKPGGFSNAASALTRFAWRRHPFPEIHGSEDLVWVEQHLRKGGKLWYLPHLRVLHSHKESALDVYKRVRLNVEAKGLNPSYGKAALLFVGVLVSMIRCGAASVDALRYARSHARAYL